jgi:Protein of unknown function (DUF2586)
VNCGVIYTALAEGVTVQQAALTPNYVGVKVQVIGSVVVVNLSTDANSIQTSTASQVAAAIVASPAASALLTAVAAGAGSGLAGGLNLPQALPVSLSTGDVFTFTTTPPTWSNADLSAALLTLLTNETALSSFSVIHIVGEAGTVDFSTLHTFLDNANNQKRQFKRGTIEGPFQLSTESEATWDARCKSIFPVQGTKVGIAVGETQILNSAYGTVDKRNVGAPYMARLMICPVSELPSHVDCETNLGVKNQLDGVLPRATNGSIPPLYQTDDTLVDMNSSNFITLRTHPGRTGLYVRQGLLYTLDGDDYTYITNGRTADVAAAVAYDEILRYLNANELTDPATGEMAEIALQKLENNIAKAVRRVLMNGQRQHVSAVACVLDRNTNFAQSGTVSGELKIVGRTPVTAIILRLGYTPTLG